MHAFLLINSSPTEFAKKQNAKVIPFVFQKIEDARELKKFVKFSFSEKTAIVIENIDTATPEAANAFLKNLEEPNKNLTYILTASNLENVLPTIISRCEVIQRHISKHIILNKSGIENFLNSKTNQKLEIVGKIKDRGEAIAFVENIVHYEHQNNEFENMEKYLGTLKNLKLNGNVSLQLTNLVVTMNGDGY